MPFKINPFSNRLDETGSGGGGGTVTSVSGTTDRITSTGGAATVIDIAGTYVGQTSLTTLGTVATGTWNATTIAVNRGGTGATTLTGVLTGNGTGAVTANAVTQYGVVVGGAANAVTSTAVGSAGQILRSGGAGVNPAYTTSTYPTTNAVNTLLYASSANVMGALSTANRGVLVTSATGVPSILASPAATGCVLLSNSASTPSFSTATYPSTAGTSGNVLTSDGTNWTSTAPSSSVAGNNSFLAYLNTSVTNATGDGTVYKVIFDIEVYDTGSNFNLATSTYTAPATGRYFFTFSCWTTTSSSTTNSRLRITTTNRTYMSKGVALGANIEGFISVVADMNINDTAIFTITNTNVGKTDAVSGLIGSDIVTCASGYRVS